MSDYKKVFSHLYVRILLIVFAGAIPGWILLVLFGYLQNERSITYQHQNNILRGRAAAGSQSRIFEETHRFLANLALVPEVRLQHRDDCASLIPPLLMRNDEIYNNILVMSPAGEVLCSGESNEGMDENVSQSLEMTIATNAFAIGDYKRKDANHRPYIDVSYPVLDEYGKVYTILSVTINVESFNRMLRTITLRPNESLTLIDRNGTIVARSPEPEKWVGKVHPFINKINVNIVHQSETSYEQVDANGLTWHFDVFRLKEPDVYFLILQHKNIPFLSDPNVYLIYISAGSLVAFGLMILLSWILTRYFIEHPLEKVIQVADNVIRGDYFIHSGLEKDAGIFGRLGRSMDRIIDTFQRQTTEQKNYERLLRQEEIRFHAIADFSTNWECWINQDGTFGYNSPACESISGYKPDEFGRDSEMMQVITHPQDRDRMNEHLREVHANMRSDLASIEFRIITKAGKIRWLLHTCQPIFGPEKEYLGRRVTNQDITKRRQTEESLRSTAQRFLAIVENQGEGIANFDADENFVFSNPAADLIFGFNPGELNTRNLKEFVIPDHLSILAQLIETLQRGEKSACELIIIRKDGMKRYVLIDATPQYKKDGRYAGAFGVFRDITEQKQREDHLVYTSTHDTLTGLYNRTYFEEEMEKTQNGDTWPVSIIVIDVDDLKIINDRLGHSAGDDLLRRTAKILRTALRPWDIVARLGGDEFVILLPNVNYDAGQEILTRIRGIFEQYNGTSTEPPLRISLGLACGDEGVTLMEIFNMADAQMYLDKKGKSNPNS